jgi:CheY-like chemotaxis protein
MLQRLIGENIELAWIPSHDLWNVRIDPSQVDQLLANLMVNSRDAISDTGRVTIKTANAVLDPAICARHPGMVPGEYVLLSVADTGCGMDQETLAHIFEPFFTTKEQDKGTGLGLATIYGIIKQNNGYIAVDSEPGQGTTCRLYLPRFQAETEVVQSQTATVQLPSGNETVLIVEDERAILELAVRILERLGYKVLSAESPRAALRLSQAYADKIHLLITDVVMPEMNGRELASKLATLRPEMKCLFISGYTSDVIASHGVLEENLNFVQKPFTITELAAKTREVLQR